MLHQNILKPTESELEVLQVLWQAGPSSVRFVNEQMNKKREVGYTTTLKIMQIMADKHLVLRDTKSRTHIYKANVNEAATQKQLLKKFVEATFRGSAMQMVLQALGNHEASNEELEKIKALIETIEKGDKS